MTVRNFGVYASSGERVYLGDFSEVPEPYRKELVEAIDEWGNVMVGWGINELVYSLMCWHEETVFECDCGFRSETRDRCETCEKTLERKPKYRRNEKIAHLLMCVGSLYKIKVEENG